MEDTGLRILLRGRNSDGTRSSELKDITALCGGIQLSGAVKSASRKLSFNTLRKDQDYYLSQIANVKRGDGIALSYNGDYIFYGIVWNVKDNDSSMQKTITCYDNMKFLMTSDVITNIWTSVTAIEVTQTVCKELGVTCGDLPETDVKISVNARNKNGYEAIMIAWTETKKTTGKVYYPKMEGYKLTVIEKGTKLEGHSLKYQPEALEGSLISVELEEDSEDAVTSIWQRNSAGTATWVKNDESLINLIGYIVGMNDSGQSTDESDVKAINDGSKICNVSAVGDWYMQTGWSVPIMSNTITEDLLYIESDVHYYENGIHTMDLELSYENSMDEIENDPIESASGGAVFGTGSPEEQIWNFLRANGFTAEAAAGVMGNMFAESGCQANIEEYSGGGGFGLCQWTGSRRTDLVNWCANNGYDYTSLEGQLNFLLYELDSYGLSYIKNITSVEEATRVFLTEFEKAGIVRWSVRINAANDYYSIWKDYTTIPTAGGVQGDGVSTGSFIWPFPNGAGTVTQYFTWNGRSGHLGMDISTTAGSGAGSPVLAVDGGVVVSAGWGVSDGSYGNEVNIQHSSGLYTRYAHLSSILVSVGQSVSKGQQIGVEGNTGNSYGTHLHFEVHAGIPNGQRYNPSNYISR